MRNLKQCNRPRNILLKIYFTRKFIYPASRGPSIFLGRSKGLCSQGKVHKDFSEIPLFSFYFIFTFAFSNTKLLYKAKFKKERVNVMYTTRSLILREKYLLTPLNPSVKCKCRVALQTVLLAIIFFSWQTISIFTKLRSERVATFPLSGLQCRRLFILRITSFFIGNVAQYL